MESKLKLYSKGIVAQSKKLNSLEILVTPIEHLAAIDGDINSDVDQYIDTGTDSNGETYQIPISTSNTITADWYNIGGSNRETAPDVVVGEEVLIYRYANTDRYRWTTVGLHPRRLETILNRFSNNRDQTVNELDDSNSYWIKLSTHEKLFVFKMTKNDGEVCEYKLYMDAKNGIAGLQDENNNSFFINSPENIVELINADDTRVSLDKTVLNIFAVDAINIETKTLTTKADTINTTAQTHNENIDSIITKGSSLDVTMSSVSYTSGSYSVRASFSITGNFAAAGGAFTHDGINLDGKHLHANGTGAMGNTGIVIPT